MESLSRLDVAVAAVAAVVAYLLWKVAHNYFSSSIPKSVPGPLLAKLTSKWLLFVELSAAKGNVVHGLHKRYGPVVQLAPNEVSFSSMEAVKPIYGHGTSCVKSEMYKLFGREGLFHMRDPERHRERVKRVAHIFSVTSLRQMEPLIHSIVADVVDIVSKNLEKPIDALHYFRLTALDIAGEILMGKSFDGLKGSETAPSYLHTLDNAYLTWGLWGMAPVLCRLLSLVPSKKLQVFLGSGHYIYEYGEDALREYLDLYGRNSSRRSLLTKLLAGDPAKGTGPLPDEVISDEASNLIFAATDSTGNTMTYSMYELSCHPEWQVKLREELRAAQVKDHAFAFQVLQNLPVLNGVLQETLRLHPPALSGLPRTTTAKETEIGGIILPAKTNVSMQALTMQRDPTIFPSPDEFDPARWISDGEIFAGTPEMREMMFVWGKGTRACLGQHMATMGIKILISSIIERFNVELGGEQTHADMEMTDHVTLIPKGRRCELVFSAADNT